MKIYIATLICLCALLVCAFIPTGNRVVLQEEYYYPQYKNLFGWHKYCPYGCTFYKTKEEAIAHFTKNKDNVVWEE